MPRVRTKRNRPPPGFEVLEPTLLDLERRMRDVESASHEGKRKTESVWPVFRIAHQRSRYVFTMYYKRGEVSREVYEYCLREGHADEALIAKWKKPGYEHLCCLSCIAPANHNFGGVCICRVPRKDLDAGKVFECPHCGCRGCSGQGGDLVVPEALAGVGFGGAGGGGGGAGGGGAGGGGAGGGGGASQAGAAAAGAAGGGGGGAAAAAAASAAAGVGHRGEVEEREEEREEEEEEEEEGAPGGEGAGSSSSSSSSSSSHGGSKRRKQEREEGE